MEGFDTPQPETKEMYPEFSGSAQEYFKIWIVNTLLCIVTLGFYIPWAKVRTRRYFYLNTSLDGERFDYLADPKKLFYGYLILAAFLIAYNLLPTINPLLVFPVILLGFIIMPWIIYKSRRFFCRNSAYRNICLKFEGSLKDSYVAYLGYAFLGLITFGLAMPLALFKQKEYFFSNLSYGNASSVFNGRSNHFFKVYFVGIAAIFGASIILFGTIAAFSQGTNPNNMSPLMSIFLSLAVLVLYLGMFATGSMMTVFITNHCWSLTSFPGLMDFKSHIHPVKYVWIQATNILAIIFSLGLLAPWAKVRLYRYRTSCLHVTMNAHINEITAQYEEAQDGALGEMAADQFDFEIGL